MRPTYTFDEMLSLLRAAKEGKSIEFWSPLYQSWERCEVAPGDVIQFNFANYQYRIAEEQNGSAKEA